MALASGSTLGLTVTYQDGATDSGSVAINHLAAPPAAMPEPGAPADVVAGDFGVSALGQDGTYLPGYVHLKVTGLAGRIIASTTLNDGAGSWWSQGDASGLHTLYVAEAKDLQSADLYFGRRGTRRPRAP